MAPKVQNENTYKDQIKLNLQRLKENQIQKVKVDLTKISIKTLASLIGVLSEYVKLYMKLCSSNRFYALNDRTIDLLMKGDIDMSATVGEGEDEISESDMKVQKILETENEVEIFVVDKNKTRSGGAFFNCLNNTLFDFDKYGVFKKLIEIIINIIVYI